MANDLIPFDDDDQLPAQAGELFGDTNDDLSGGVNLGYPVISYRGKTWAINEGDVRTPVTRKIDDEEVPSPYIEVVIVKANPNLSKTYYKHGYEEGSTEKPTCYSHDGRAPAPDAAEPQAAACLACPHNAWGSRVTENGSKGKACQDYRRLCVVPSGQLDRPMLLRVPAGSLKDLVAYGDMLKRRKTPYQAVVTRISFDVDAAHPKFVFKAKAWLGAQSQKEIAELMQQDIVQQVVGTPTPVESRPAIATAPKTKASVDEADIDDAIARRSARKAAPQVVSSSDVEQAIPKEEKAPAAPKKKSGKVSTLIEEADAQLESLLSGHFNAE